MVGAQGMFDYLFNKYKPDMVLATDIQDLRVQELCDTRWSERLKEGYLQYGYGRSWDSMTTKGLLKHCQLNWLCRVFLLRDQAVGITALT